MKTETKSPFQLIISALAAKYSISVDTNSTKDEVVEVLLNNHINVVLVLDEVDRLYAATQDDISAKEIMNELCFLGELDGRRPIIVILSGSVAVLRSLCFAIPGLSESIFQKYPCYMRFTSLNNRKYQDLHLKPVGTLYEMNDVMRSMAIQYPLDTVEDSIEEVFVKSRGLVSLIHDICCNQLDRAHHFNRLFRDQTRTDYMKYLFDAWVKSIQEKGLDIVLAARDFDTNAISNFRTGIKDNMLELAYELMDIDVIHFDDTVTTRQVGFFHPSDVGACILKFN